MDETDLMRETERFLAGFPAQAPEGQEGSVLDFEQQLYYQVVGARMQTSLKRRGLRWWLFVRWARVRAWWRDNVAWRFRKEHRGYDW